MKKRPIKGYLYCGLFIFLFMFFITWQRVTIVRLGYEVSDLKNDLREIQVKNQILLKQYSRETSLRNIHTTAVKKYGMSLPDMNSCRSVVISYNYRLEDGNVAETVTSFLKKVFGPGKAQAK